MKIYERRIVALLILLLGLTILTAGILTNQANYLLDFVRRIFEPSIAGVP